MNARIGTHLNQSHNLQCIEKLVPDSQLNDTSDRSSCDNVTNNYGRKLDKLCKLFNLCIANGRTLGDRLGNFTCYNHKGASVVDYVISDQSFFRNIKQLKVMNPEYGSIHTPISFTFPECGTEIKILWLKVQPRRRAS